MIYTLKDKWDMRKKEDISPEEEFSIFVKLISEEFEMIKKLIKDTVDVHQHQFTTGIVKGRVG